MKHLIILALSITLFTSCATLFSGSRAKIILEDRQVTAPVNLTIDDQKHYNILLPARVKVKRGYKPSVITAEAQGYEPSTIMVQKKFNGKTLWNILWGGIPGIAIDAATGALMKPKYNHYDFGMQPLGSFGNVKNAAIIKDPTIMAGEENNMVTRDAPGQTALERTVIRWYFDSEPRGARIFYRVISSIPSIVKNTNETYLMTTPFEETRAFNILGLTYENSRDVQIEIKLSKKGYEDQIKRFNVRQAIDQQEISSFFEMVEKEN